jgi:transposase
MLSLDECAFSTTPLVKRSWAPRGETPIVTHPASRRKLTAIAGVGLMPSGRAVEMFTLYDHNAQAETFFWWLYAAHRHFRRKLIVVWDNLRAHKKAAEHYARLRVPWLEFAWLPPYAPDLNPVERLWCDTKYHALANWTPKNLDELRRRASEELEKRRHLSSRLKSYITGCGLEVAGD